MKNKIIKTATSLAVAMSMIPSTTFAKEEAKKIYDVPFVYDDKDEKDAVKVTVSGTLQFYKVEDTKDFIVNGKAPDAHSYSAFDYEEGMFNTGYGFNGDTQVYELKETEDEHFELTLPLPASLYAYDYEVTYADGTKVKMKDPSNMPYANPFSGHDSGHSLILVGDKENALAGQEYIYPQEGNKGTVSYVTYTAVDGTTQPLGIYLPHGFKADGTYKTLYVSHGGGGNEVEWMEIGAAKTIMDNLINEGSVEPTVVVTMDNTYFGWNYEKIAENFEKHIIPFMEETYSVAEGQNNRALCGLSMGSMTTTTLLQLHTELFGHYGAFSGANCRVEGKDIEAMKEVNIYLTGGSVDMATKATTPEGDVGIGGPAKTIGIAGEFDEAGIEYDMDILNGAHDWGVWRESLTNFVKDHLWNERVSKDHTSSVVVKETTNEEWNAPYTATFTVQVEDAVSVSIKGGFAFYKEEECKDFVGLAVMNQPQYTPYEYTEDMFVAGNTVTMPMERIAKGTYSIEMPLPGNQYYYAYEVEYADGTKVQIGDPSNPIATNSANGHNATWSTIKIGDKDHTTAGQEYIYENTEGKTGTFSYVEYTAVDGTKQPAGVYLPYGYDSNKTYKTIYVSHGGGGNEVEWMTIGSVPQIMDNLIAEGEVAEAIVVTMDHTYFGWDYDKIAKNFTDHLIPYIEENYSVSKEASDRALCGLSMGSMTTNTMTSKIPEAFGYFGAFSGGNQDLDKSHYSAEAMKDKVYYLTAGCIDIAYNNKAGISSLDYIAMLDELGIEYDFELLLGAHDWYVWRESFTTFAKDYLWDAPQTPVTPEIPTVGIANNAIYAGVAVATLAGIVALKKKKED